MAVNAQDGDDATNGRQQPDSLGAQHLVALHETGGSLDPVVVSGFEDGIDGDGAEDPSCAGGGCPQSVGSLDDQPRGGPFKQIALGRGEDDVVSALGLGMTQCRDVDGIGQGLDTAEKPRCIGEGFAGDPTRKAQHVDPFPLFLVGFGEGNDDEEPSWRSRDHLATGGVDEFEGGLSGDAPAARSVLDEVIPRVHVGRGSVHAGN